MRKTQMKGPAALAASALLALAASQAHATSLPIIGNFTEVEVTADLASFGLTAAPFGSATAVGAIFTFPVTGGSQDSLTGDALVEHDGSGVALTAGASSAFVGNFLIDTAAATVFGDGAVLGGEGFIGAPLFTFGSGDALPGVELLFSPTLAGALSAVFGAPDLTGATFGYARPDLAVVPVPAAGVLLLSALGVMGAIRRRQLKA